MKIRNIDTFYWIASLGSFRAAAEKLNLTQPAISARIQVLEQDLGCAVFLRDIKNAELTPEGRRLFPFAERLMALDQETLAAFSETSPINQIIRLGSSETIVATWLPDFLGSFGRAQNGRSFELTVDGTNNLRDALVSREIDIAFLMGPIAEATISNHQLCAFEMVFAANQELASQKRTWTLSEIAHQQILTFPGDTRPTRQISEMLKPYRSGALEMTTSTTLGALVRLATKGFGVCAIPRAVIGAELASGDLVQLKTKFSLPTIAFTASYVSASPMSIILSQICRDVSVFIEPHIIKNIYQI